MTPLPILFFFCFVLIIRISCVYTTSIIISGLLKKHNIHLLRDLQISKIHPFINMHGTQFKFIVKWKWLIFECVRVYILSHSDKIALSLSSLFCMQFLHSAIKIQFRIAVKPPAWYRFSFRTKTETQNCVRNEERRPEPSMKSQYDNVEWQFNIYFICDCFYTQRRNNAKVFSVSSYNSDLIQLHIFFSRHPITITN